jgi:hypothetical protein
MMSAVAFMSVVRAIRGWCADTGTRVRSLLLSPTELDRLRAQTEALVADSPQRARDLDVVRW